MTQRCRATDGTPREVVLDPAITKLLAATSTPPTLQQLGPRDGRAALREVQRGSAAVRDTDAEFLTCPVGPCGLTGIWRIRPRGLSGRLPGVIYLHGGRWMFGDGDTHAHIIDEVAQHCRACLIVPEYTRTPEARYPVALEECYAVLTWAHRHADDLGINPRNLAIAGDCVGATLAIAVCLLAKSRGGPRLRAQLLYYPPTDACCDCASHQIFADGFLLSRDEQRWYWDQYCDDDCSVPTVSPLYATSDELAGLPPAMVITAEADVVRDEGAAFAAKLRAAGVAVTAIRYLGTIHDFVALRQLSDIPPTRAALAQGIWFLNTALHR
jgi:acetyl esterase